MKFDVTTLPAGAKVVRLLKPGEDYGWDHGIVVTELDGGKTLHLEFWHGKFEPAVWKRAQAELFPSAERVQYERWRNGAFRLVTIPLSPWL